jgi:serine/threonine protein kinase
VAVRVAHALDYLHGNANSRPVIHRDVKSSNILISELFEPKVIFFCRIEINICFRLSVNIVLK